MDDAELHSSSIIRSLVALSRQLDPDRFRTHVWFLYSGGPLVELLQAAGAQVRVVPWKGGLRNPAGAWRFWHALRRERNRYSIVHEHLLGRSLRLLIRGATPAKLISHFHIIWFRDRDGVYEPVRKWSWGAHSVICPSRAVARTVAGARPRVVYTGIQTPVDYERRLIDESRREKVIGTAGSLVLIKGISFLLQAMCVLRAQIPDLRLEIAGDGPLRSALEAEAVSLGLADCVKFLGWQRSLLPVLKGWDVYVQPSLLESLGIAALEAMSVGLPVVASAAGGLEEVVADGETGWLVPPRDPKALADRIQILISRPELGRAMGDRGRERVCKVFSLDRMVAEIQQIYDQLLNLADGKAISRAGGPSSARLPG